MKNNFFRRRLLPLAFALLLSVSCFTGIGAGADKQSDLKAKQQQLKKEYDEVQNSLSEYKNLVEESEENMKEYAEKIKLQEKQVALVAEQIELCNEDIASLEESIAAKEADLDLGIEQFKQRLRALYMAGNDSLASVVAGSSDFYDMLARMEFVERISKHDNDLINDLNEQITSLNSDKAEYEAALLELETKKAEEEKYAEELRETYKNSAEMKKMRENMIADYRERANEIEEEQDKVEKELQAEIRRLQEEAERKRKEEEARRKAEEEAKRKAAEEKGETFVSDYTAPATYSDTGFIWPVPTVRAMSDGFGNRWIVEEQRSNYHKGIDITKPGCAGQPTVAAAGGTVIQAGNSGNGYGNCVIIDHGDKISTLYAHHQSLAVKVGDVVTQGQTLGYIGQTGNAYGNHLHFEVRVNGQPVDPLKYVNINN